MLKERKADIGKNLDIPNPGLGNKNPENTRRFLSNAMLAAE